MANKESPLAYLPIAITIVTLSRIQLLGSFHYLKNRGYNVCYADTDSLMVHHWPYDHCDQVNAFLKLPHVELKYEQCMKRLVGPSKKRYVFERMKNEKLVTKKKKKKVNGLVEFMTSFILERVWDALFINPTTNSSEGWEIWTKVLLEANYRCRDPKKYSIYRKIKKLDQYVSNKCPAVMYLKKYPNKTDEYVEFTYSRADVALAEASNWVMDVEDCQWVDYEKLFISQKKIFTTLLNLTFWKEPDPTCMTEMVLNGIHWEKFVHAEFLHRQATGRRVLLLVEKSIKYTFEINDHLSPKNKNKSQNKEYVASRYMLPGKKGKVVKNSNFMIPGGCVSISTYRIVEEEEMEEEYEEDEDEDEDEEEEEEEEEEEN